MFAEPLPLMVGAAAAGPFTPSRSRPVRPFADRPGKQVQIDSVPLDMMVILDSEVTAQADLPIVLPRLN
ncbi:hypothetical protein ACF09H_11350 [Streptomyces sp. NPDC014983]|uniref:hypothetical protein n=1 Tax=Streptomyces sp. NPDC014983 TaxID=3364933 RepID=UPI0036F8B1E5